MLAVVGDGEDVAVVVDMVVITVVVAVVVVSIAIGLMLGGVDLGFNWLDPLVGKGHTPEQQAQFVPATSLDSPFPQGVGQPVGNTLGPLTGVGGQIEFGFTSVAVPGLDTEVGADLLATLRLAPEGFTRELQVSGGLRAANSAFVKARVAAASPLCRCGAAKSIA